MHTEYAYYRFPGLSLGAHLQSVTFIGSPLLISHSAADQIRGRGSRKSQMAKELRVKYNFVRERIAVHGLLKHACFKSTCPGWVKPIS